MPFACQKSSLQIELPWPSLGGFYSMDCFFFWWIQDSSCVRRRSCEVHFRSNVRRNGAPRAESFGKLIVQKILNSLAEYANRIGYLAFSQSPAIHQYMRDTINIFLGDPVAGCIEVMTYNHLCQKLHNIFTWILRK